MKQQFILFWGNNITFVDATKYNRKVLELFEELKHLVNQEPETRKGSVYVIDRMTYEMWVLLLQENDAVRRINLNSLPQDWQRLVDNVAYIFETAHEDKHISVPEFYAAIPKSDFKNFIKEELVKLGLLGDEFSKFVFPERAKAFAGYFVLRTSEEINEIEEVSIESNIYGTPQDGQYYVLTEDEVVDRFGEETLYDEDTFVDGMWYFIPA